MKSLMTAYDVYGNPLAPGASSNFQNQVTAPNGATFNDHLNNLNFRSNMHDMRDLMKSLNHENESIINQSR